MPDVGLRGEAADGLDVMVEVQRPSEWRLKSERHRQMARAAIRVALAHGIPDSVILAEYEKVRAEEASRNG